MLQFYFLSILLNLLCGLSLLYGEDFTPEALRLHRKSENPVVEKVDKGSVKSLFKNSRVFSDKSFRLVLGVLSCLTGLMKLLSVIRNDVPVVGDLIPALAGLIGGSCLLIEYYLMSATVETALPSWIKKIFIDNRKNIGIICIVAAVLHFIFPTVLFL
ncbi:MAG: hypothetical protein LKF96_01245 [Treponema sp.]|jgi:uncharacterized membrane-anchored protein|nr:hypothetical protein [Treponema sp.]